MGSDEFARFVLQHGDEFKQRAVADRLCSDAEAEAALQQLIWPLTFEKGPAETDDDMALDLQFIWSVYQSVIIVRKFFAEYSAELLSQTRSIRSDKESMVLSEVFERMLRYAAKFPQCCAEGYIRVVFNNEINNFYRRQKREEKALRDYSKQPARVGPRTLTLPADSKVDDAIQVSLNRLKEALHAVRNELTSDELRAVRAWLLKLKRRDAIAFLSLNPDDKRACHKIYDGPKHRAIVTIQAAMAAVEIRQLVWEVAGLLRKHEGDAHRLYEAVVNVFR